MSVRIKPYPGSKTGKRYRAQSNKHRRQRNRGDPVNVQILKIIRDNPLIRADELCTRLGTTVGVEEKIRAFESMNIIEWHRSGGWLFIANLGFTVPILTE